MVAGVASLALEARLTAPQLRRNGRLCNGSISTARGSDSRRSCAAGRRPSPARAQTVDDVFQVSEIPVDATAADAVAAREEALVQGQIEGLRRLLRRLVPPRKSASSAARSVPAQIERYVQSFEIADERVSATAISPQLTVGYEPDAVRDLLQGASATLRRDGLGADRGPAGVPRPRTVRSCGRTAIPGGRHGPTIWIPSACCASCCRSATSRTWPRSTADGAHGRGHGRAGRAGGALWQRRRAGGRSPPRGASEARRPRRRRAGARARDAPRSAIEQANPPETVVARPGETLEELMAEAVRRPAGQPRRAVEERQSLALRPAWHHGGRHPDCAAVGLGGDQPGVAGAVGSRSGRRHDVCQETMSAPRFVTSAIELRLEEALGRLGLALSREGESWRLLPTAASPSQGAPASATSTLVLSRSPVNLANLVTIGRLLMVVPLVWLIVTERLQAGVLAVPRGRRCRMRSTASSPRTSTPGPISGRTWTRSPTRCC